MTNVRRVLVIAAVAPLAWTSCGDDDELRGVSTAGGTDAPTPSTQRSNTEMDTSVTSSSAATSVASASSSTDEVFDPVAEVIAAAVAHFFSGSTFDTLHVVERLGEDEFSDGVVTFDDEAPALTNGQREAIEAALSPRAIVWVHDFDAATGPEVTLPPEQAVVMIASPKIQTDHAKTAVNIWCGMTCGGGYGLDLERSSTGDWNVTGQFGGFVA